MDQRRWRYIEALYHAALEKEPGDRDSYLHEACGGDEDLLRHVESLLRQDVSRAGLLDRPAWEAAESPLSPRSTPHGLGGGNAVSSNDPLIGRVMGQFKITERLGSGGMGVVYKAEDTALRRFVALKFLASDAMANEETKERLVREAQAAAALDHPNICHVHGIHEVEGRLFIAMAYVDGPSLAERIKGEELALGEALRIAVSVAEGLLEAHGRGIVHRDIKPQNIMLTARGQVRIMDFGLAKVAGRSKLTKSGSALGTPAYMAPEQLLGEEADSRTDVWALGCVLHEMLTQRAPFEADYEQAVAYAIVNIEPEPVTALRPELPAELDRILSKALAKDPQERYQDMAQLAADLRNVDVGRTNGPTGATYSPARPPVKISRRNIVLAGTSGALASVGVGTYFWLATPGRVESLAILPFELQDAPPSDEYLAEGLAEGLIVNLARSAGLKVLSRDAAFRYQGRSQEARAIGARLKVGAVLKGRLVRRGSQVVISAELINSSDGSVVWSGRFRRPANNMLDLDREMASAIAARLELTLGDDQPFQPVAFATNDPEAYRLYLLGRYHWNRRDNSLAAARDHFQQAVEIDPEYALAWAGLADAYLMLGAWSLLAPGDSHPRAAVAARRSIELYPIRAEPHATLGYVQVIYERDWTGARSEFEQALELDPSYATAHHWFAFYHLTVGDSAQALTQMKEAHGLDPLSPIINVELAYFLFFARFYDECEEAARQALKLDPSLGYAHSELARSYAMRGREPEARLAIAQALELTGNSIFAWMFCGLSYARLGDVAGAVQMLAKLSAHVDSAYVSPQIPGMVYAALGENDRSFELFDASIKERSFIASWLRDPMLDDFSKDSRFAEMLDGIGLQA